MATLEITPSSLVIHIEGADRLFAFTSRLEVPLGNISSVEVNPAEAHQVWHGLRLPGTNLPGVITAGRFLQKGQWSFWDVHNPDKAICINLHDEHYAKLVVGVDDQEVAALAIRSALHRS